MAYLAHEIVIDKPRGEIFIDGVETETACPDCVDAAACVDAVLPEGWRRDIGGTA